MPAAGSGRGRAGFRSWLKFNKALTSSMVTWTSDSSVLRMWMPKCSGTQSCSMESSVWVAEVGPVSILSTTVVDSWEPTVLRASVCTTKGMSSLDRMQTTQMRTPEAAANVKIGRAYPGHLPPRAELHRPVFSPSRSEPASWLPELDSRMVGATSAVETREAPPVGRLFSKDGCMPSNVHMAGGCTAHPTVIGTGRGLWIKQILVVLTSEQAPAVS
mmetsp:Transcript_64309/g.188188  ORF Transcript_64309/g.188188 Transcript_64309/m.188188 type:complete len:216 (+) Transcript_64309:37-684(+)